MKKNLLTVGTLLVTLLASAQTPLTYIEGTAKLYVSTGALVYSGGNLQLNSSTEKAVENKGSIMIVGDYLKGNNIPDGKEFVNVYTDATNYGQVIFLSSSGATDSKMTMERPAATQAYFGSDYAISFPYKGKVESIMPSFGLAESAFKGTCPKDASCGNTRYTMTMFKWNNNKVHHDAVVTGENLVTGDDYILNLRAAGGLQPVMTGMIGYKGMPSPIAYSATGKSIIPGKTESEFNDLGYNSWKNLINPYNEFYRSYLGDYNSTSKTYGKNIYRFGNPYTSNLDLSAFDGSNAWLIIKNGGTNRTVKAATDALMIKNFTVNKTMPDYDINWSPTSGSSNGNTQYYRAQFDGTQWTGNANALLIKPLETFSVSFPMLDPSNLGSRIIEVEAKFNDNHKTFNYTPSNPGSSTPTGAIIKSATARSAQAAVSSPNTQDFYQAELFLLKDGVVQSDPAYLVGASYKPVENDTPENNSNKIFVYGVKDDALLADSKKQFKAFNSTEYTRKPLPVGFNNLAAGETYEIRAKLYEGSIFNSVTGYANDKFYLLDTQTKKAVELVADKPYSFVAAGNSTDSNRFVVYWNGTPEGVLSASDVKTTNQSTFIYKENRANKLRFEYAGKRAKLAIYDMSGKLVSNYEVANTTNDFEINIGNVQGMFLVRVVYQTGETRDLKFIN